MPCPPFISWTTTTIHALNVNKFSFFTCVLVGDKKLSPTTNMGLATMHFLILECLIKKSSFKRNNYPTLDLWTNFTLHHVQLPIIFTNKFKLIKYCCALVLVNLIQFTIFCDFFFGSLGPASSTWGGALNNKILFPFSYVNDETFKKYIGA